MLQAYIKDDFDNLLQYRQWVDGAFVQLGQKNQFHTNRFSKNVVEKRITEEPDWFGEDTGYAELAAGITQYKDPDLIEEIYQKVTDKLGVGIHQQIPRRRVEFNPFGLGMFSFDRAAMGLYRLPEYYSPSLGICVDKSAVSPANNGYVLTADGSSIVERWEQREDGQPKLRTTVKKVFVYYPRISKEKQAVDIYIGCGGPADITAEEFLYSGIPAIVIAQLLEEARIPTRIFIAVGTSPYDYESEVYAALIPVKQYDEPLDSNLIATLSSDPRFYRFEGFKGVISVYEHFGARCPSNLGYGLNNETLAQTIEDSTYTQTAQLAPNRLYFGRTFSEKACINAIKNAIVALR